MILETLKRELEALYEIRVPLALEDFLVTDRDTITRLAAPPPADTREALFLLEEEDGAAMALFIDATVLERLADDDPREDLHEGNLADFLIALEGVSHFVYVAWRASHHRPVTQLELEVQAEVDKFASCAMLLGRQSAGHVPENLATRLFAPLRLLPGLEADRRARYARANDYAGRFCAGLERRYIRPREGAALTRELRRFYRFDQRQKLAHIESGRTGNGR